MKVFLKIITTISILMAHNALANASKGATATKLNATGKISWTGTGIGKSHTGDLSLKSGELMLTGNDITGGQFVFDMNTIEYKNQRLVGHLKSADFFEVEKFPEARFVIKSVKALPASATGPTHEITGDLTIKDKTNSITFPARVSQKDGQWTAQGELTIADRTKYGITYNSKQFFSPAKLGDKLIEDEIKIGLNLMAKK